MIDPGCLQLGSRHVDVVDLEQRHRPMRVVAEEVEIRISRRRELNLIALTRLELDRRLLVEVHIHPHDHLEEVPHGRVVLGRHPNPADVPHSHDRVVPTSLRVILFTGFSGSGGSFTLRRVEELLLAWFGQNGRDLPWRKMKDPYAILVSEVMSQQTQVERVVPRWRRWLDRWPTVDALAAAPAADVIREWQGLGYNRRALSLHRAARHVATQGWPEDLTELPGIGRYTADAVACFAFGHAVLPVDVNVRRVSERTGHSFSPAAAQALMDLGKAVCLARVPRCGACPLAGSCPSRGRRYEPERRQGPFEGSFRQRRAAALRLVVGGEQPEDTDAVVSLVRDGLVRVDGEVVSLPD
jgi:A/G-specific adenine glycosylase